MSVSRFWIVATIVVAGSFGFIPAAVGQSPGFTDLLKPSTKVATPAAKNLELQFLEAQKLQKAGKIDQALKIYTAMDKVSPNNVAILLNMGMIYRMKNASSTAKPFFLRVLKIDPKNVPALFHLGAICFQTGDKKQALSYSLKLAKIKPGDFQVQSMLGIAYLENGNLEKGGEALRKAHAINPSDPGTIINLVRISSQKKDYASTLLYANRLLAMNPKDSRLQIMAGFAAEKVGKKPEAIKHYESASGLPGVQIDALMNLARLYAAAGQNTKSTNALKRVLKLDKNNYEANIRLGQDLYMRSNLKQAEPFFIAAQKSKPKNAEPSLFIALIRARTNRLDDAFKAAQAAIDKSPKNKSVMEVYGYVQENRKVYDDAINNYRKWLKLYPEDTFIFPKIANILVIQGKPDLAIAEYDAAIKKYPKDFNLAMAYADLLMGQQSYEKAYTSFQAALVIKPGQIDASIGSAICLQKQNKIDDAIKVLDKVVVASPDNERARITLGGIYRDQKKDDLAVEQYKKVLEKAPLNMNALLPLVSVYESQKNYEAAIGVYRELIKADPKNVAFPVTIVNLYDSWGKRDQAIEECTKLTKADPKNTDYRATLAALLMKKEDWDGAIAEYSELVKAEVPKDKAFAYVKCGEIREKQNKTDLAIESYKLALDAVPEYARSLDALERIYNAQNKQDDLQVYIKGLIEQGKDNSPYSFYYHLLHVAGKGPEAIKTLEAISVGNPKLTAVHSTLAIAYTDAGDNGKAVEQYMLMLAANPNDAAINKKLGMLLKQMGKDQEALKYLESAAAVNTFDRKLILDLAATYEKLNDRTKAKKTYKDYLKMDPANQEIKNKIKDLEADKP